MVVVIFKISLIPCSTTYIQKSYYGRDREHARFLCFRCFCPCNSVCAFVVCIFIFISLRLKSILKSPSVVSRNRSSHKCLAFLSLCERTKKIILKHRIPVHYVAAGQFFYAAAENNEPNRVGSVGGLAQFHPKNIEYNVRVCDSGPRFGSVICVFFSVVYSSISFEIFSLWKFD